MPGAEATALGSVLAEGAAALELAKAPIPLTLIASGACATGAAIDAEITEERIIKKVDWTNIVQRVCGDKKVGKCKVGLKRWAFGGVLALKKMFDC
jgi:hypothetical protein